MNFESVKAWLERRLKKQAGFCFLKFVLGLTLGPVALAAAVLLVFLVMMAFSQRSGRDFGDARKCALIALCAAPLMFLGNRLIPRRNLMEERMADPTSASRVEARLQFLLWILFAGPRLFGWAIRSFREAERIRRVDAHSCGAVLWMMLNSVRKVTFEEIQRDLDWLNLDDTLADLREIDGVLVLHGPPPAFSMTPELREEIKTGVAG